uniref:Uncharacterized protein n=1 Tax=Oryza nivara TaxID=4536 RepID=A0A0E0G8Z5_ORYNI
MSVTKALQVPNVRILPSYSFAEKALTTDAPLDLGCSSHEAKCGDADASQRQLAVRVSYVSVSPFTLTKFPFFSPLSSLLVILSLPPTPLAGSFAINPPPPLFSSDPAPPPEGESSAAAAAPRTLTQ